MSVSTSAAPSASPTPWSHVTQLALGVVLALAVLLAAFAWPATQLALRDVPVAVVAPGPVIEQVVTAVEQNQPGALDPRPAADVDEARQLVRDREVAGALVLDPRDPRVLVATQGGPAVAQALVQVARGASGQDVAVEDLAPPPPGDPRGAGLAAGTLPLALGGALAGAALALRVRGPARRIAGALLVAVLGGPTAVAVLHGWLGALSGNVLVESAVIALGLAATSAGVLGAHALAGRVGLVLAELVVIALGNPLSAAAAAPLMLPDGWRELGQALPPGALVSALRAVSGFDGAGAGAPLAVLTGWLLAGLLLVAVAAVLPARRTSLAGEHTVSPAPATSVN